MITTKERSILALNGWGFLACNLLLGLGAVAIMVWLVIEADANRTDNVWLLWLTIPALIGHFVVWAGHFTLEPNHSCVMLLFGDYKGTVRQTGFLWTNPFYTKKKISVRNRNFDGHKLKVNDLRGNPIEISAVIVWRVVDTATAVFDVDNFEHFVKVQSESALRHLASDYPYEPGDDDDDGITLRSGGDAINQALQTQVQERLNQAGVKVEEARLNHLAYAPEIASVMLKRQQAEAVIAARTKIVHGAVSMVHMALKELAEQEVVEFDEERKAAMVSNLLVILCGESEAQPVINTGTLYN